MPHEDGTAYYPLVATVSLGAPIVLDIHVKKQPERDGTDTRLRVPRYRILQEPRSLLITTHDLYEDFLHGIAERSSDEGLNSETICNWHMLGDTQLYSKSGRYERRTRISLTYRDVLKVAKIGNSVKFLIAGR
jgi:alkylated DNA repair protein alkB family protein 6